MLIGLVVGLLLGVAVMLLLRRGSSGAPSGLSDASPLAL